MVVLTYIHTNDKCIASFPYQHLLYFIFHTPRCFICAQDYFVYLGIFCDGIQFLGIAPTAVCYTHPIRPDLSFVLKIVWEHSVIAYKLLELLFYLCK